jgi:hypothetical protein
MVLSSVLWVPPRFVSLSVHGTLLDVEYAARCVFIDTPTRHDRWWRPTR